MELMLIVVVVVLIALSIAKAVNGTWGTTWAGSGYEPGGQKIPGVRAPDSVSASTAESPPMRAVW